MIPGWVLATFAAVIAQTIRFSLQKSLRGLGLSAAGATFSRFLFAAPLAALLATSVILAKGLGLPSLSPRFAVMVMLGGLAQILATQATVALFTRRAFAVGIAFTKSETLLVAGFSVVVLGEAVSAAGLVAMLLGATGVILLSLRPGAEARFFNGATALGLTAGALFGLSAIGYRGATLALGGGDTLTRAAVTLAVVTTFQTGVMVVALRLFQPGEIGKVVANLRRVVWVGVTGMLGSLFWFIALALENAAYVRALGQAEVALSILGGWLVFRERPRGLEVLGMALLAASLAALILVA